MNDQLNITNTSTLTADTNKVPKGITFNYSENFNRVVELSIDNYVSWRTNILYLLMINNLESYITKEKVKKLRKRDVKDDIDDYFEDRFDSNLVYDKDTNFLDIKNDVLVKWIITNSLGEKTKKIIEGQGKTAFQVWEILSKSFTRSPERRKLEIKNKINNLKFNEDDDINIFIATLQNAIDEYEVIDHDISDSSKAGILNRALPENLRWINVFQYKDDWNKLCDYVKNVIPDIIFSNLRETNDSKQNESIFHLETNQTVDKTNLKKQRRKKGKCYKCGIFGHYAKDCKAVENLKTKRITGRRQRKFTTKRSHRRPRKSNHNHNHNYCPTKVIATANLTEKNDSNKNFTIDYDTDTATVLTITTLNKDNNENEDIHQTKNSLSSWIIDSGASVHITNSLKLLNNIHKCNELISTANGEIVRASLSGEFTGYINNNKFTIKNVYYVPGIKRNIISVSQLIKQHIKIVFHNSHGKSTVSLYNSNGKRIIDILSNKQNIFKIWITSSSLNYLNENNHPEDISKICYITNKEKLNLWHRRLGHFSINGIRDKISKISINDPCATCSRSKLKRKSFQRASNNTTRCLEIIHMDLVGPIKESIHGNKYFLSILDDFSRYGWVFFFPNKSDTFSIFYTWFLKIRNTFNTGISYIQTDNGTEFVNHKFKSLCLENGITHRLIIPYNSPQNGRIERLNGTLITAAKSLLSEAKLSHHFWEYAVDTANFLHNRIPHRGIKNRIPFEIFYRTKVDYSHLRVFGCRVFFYIPKSFRAKFDNNTLPGIFLGYNINPPAYKILDITNNKIVLARSVAFFEDIPANSRLLSNTQFNPPNFLPYSKIRGSDYTSTNIFPFKSQQIYTNLPNNHKQEKEEPNNIGSEIQKKGNKISSNETAKEIHTTHPSNSQNELNHIATKNNNTLHRKRKNIETTPFNKRTKNMYNKLTTRPPVTQNSFKEPKYFNEIYYLPDKQKWLDAVNEELRNMKRLNVYSPVESIPEGANTVSSKWVFKYKRNAQGSIIRRKARLVARGFSQKYGIDYNETFSPTLKMDSLRLIISIAIQKGFSINQIDINSAYLNAPLKETIYMKAPEGQNTHKYWKLNKALYGLKQAGREWNNKLNDEILKMKFRRLKSEPCIYAKESQDKNITCILGVYVDDILILGYENEVRNIKILIKGIFNIKDIGEVDFVIGIKFEKCKEGYILHQKNYISTLLEKYSLTKSIPIRTPKPVENMSLRKKTFDSTAYRSAFGNLLYLAICTRPDILLSVSRAAKRNDKPTYEDWENVIRILRYLKGTINYGIKITNNKKLNIYADSDFSGDTETRRSTTGFLFTIGNAPISWYSKLQHCVATSTAEAEYYALSECAKHALWYMNVVNELNIYTKSVDIYIDNKAAIHNSINQSINRRSKHIDIRYHYIRELINDNKIKLSYIRSNDNVADGFTKYLNGPQMDKFRNNLLQKIID